MEQQLTPDEVENAIEEAKEIMAASKTEVPLPPVASSPVMPALPLASQSSSPTLNPLATPQVTQPTAAPLRPSSIKTVDNDIDRINKVTITSASQKLEIQDLQKATKKALVMDDINITVHAGEIFALVGNSASGKTLLSKLVVNLVKKTKGEVLIAGIPNKRTRITAKKVGASLEQQNFYTKFTPYKTLLQYAQLNLYPVSSARINNTLNLVDLKKMKNVTLDRLSQSSITRLKIAVALYARPEIVILDDPFRNLSDVEAHRVRVVIKTIAATKNTAVLLTTQDIRNVEGICDTIGVIDDGFMVTIKSYNQFVRDDSPHSRLRVMTTMPHYTAKTIEEKLNVRTFMCGEWVVVDTKPSNAQRLCDVLVAADIKVLSMQRVNRSLSEQFREIVSSKSRRRAAVLDGGDAS